MKTKVKFHTEVNDLRESYYLAYKINCGNENKKFYLIMCFVFYVASLIIAVASGSIISSTLFYLYINLLFASLICLWKVSKIQTVLNKDMRKYKKIMDKKK
jgi:isoprenylcysteine carboxyl methyltransferase (ICMT) family protein YpbQ